MRSEHFKIVGILFLLCATSFFFRFTEKETSPLWTDEFATYWIANADTLAETVARCAPTQGQSPFFYIIQHYILKVLPHNEYSLRLFPQVCSLACVLLVFVLCNSLLRYGTALRGAEQDDPKTTALPAILAALLFAMDINQVYYAQEARPYTLATLFALASQIFFLEMLISASRLKIVAYIICSSLLCYTHYIFGTLLVFQNLWMLCIFIKTSRAASLGVTCEFRKPPVGLTSWCLMQAAILLSLLPAAMHLYPVLKDSSRWTWLQKGGIVCTFRIFASLFDWQFISMFAAAFIMMHVWDKLQARQAGKGSRQVHMISDKSRFDIVVIFLVAWIFTAPLCAYFATVLLNSSFLDSRYMTLSLIPCYLLPAVLLYRMKNRYMALFLASFMLFAYLGAVSVPTFKREGRFSNRILHDWRKALATLNEQLAPGDIIVMRSGIVRENCIPDTDSDIIRDYAKAPLKSFYFSPRMLQDPKIHIPPPNDGIPEHCLLYGVIPVFSMTYTREVEFYDYYRSIFSRCEKSERVWLIGVDPPNTNYPFSKVPLIIDDTHSRAFEKNLSGVYLALLRKRPDIYRIFRND